MKLTMPRKGRKTIDQPEVLVNMLQLKYDENKGKLQLDGVTTFQGFITKLLTSLLLKQNIPDGWEKYLELSPDDVSSLIDADQPE